MSTSTMETAIHPAVGKSADHVTALHNHILKIAESNAPYPNPIGQAEPLIGFNGYYALNQNGAFLTVDTNLLVQNGQVIPHVALIHSADGTSSNVYDLTGPNRAFDSVAWSNNTLTATASTGSNAPSFSLSFTRENSTDGVTVAMTGTITPGNSTEPLSLQGNTYNNPIPMDMYAGTYYESQFLGKAGQGAAIMQIGTNNTLKYNYTNIGIGDGGTLTEVTTFVYNLNMYVFTFLSADGKTNYNMIMGTSAKGGMLCNNMITKQGAGMPSQRSLQTIHSYTTVPHGDPNSKSAALAEYAGFYRLSYGTNAWLSVEGEYKTSTTGATSNTVTFSLSMEGTTAEVYTFDDSMALTGNDDKLVLRFPADVTKPEVLSVTFTREFNAAYPSIGSYYGSVASISGSYNGTSFTGATLLNVVPLEAFAGAGLRVKASDPVTIVVKSNSEVEYNGVVYPNDTPRPNGKTYPTMTVVPLMYIVGFIDNKGDEVIMSLGTDGGKGVTCITTVYPVTDGKRGLLPKSIEVSTAIPNGDSGAPVPS